MSNNRNEVVRAKYTSEEKLKAAYALNMCTVSVSQIVDYNDAYVLEQEYDAILNNLNIEQIPKDDNLLRTLIELLNTITFFRIQEIKKNQIERKYQEEMKSAIWSAIPNLSVIVASPDPLAIGLSLVTQVGVGYMNYRKTLSQNKRSKSDAEIELQITAIEQLNSLKRELFSTAWKLAERYKFADKLRLTERQIKQYNEILIDGDDERKYARLEAIKENFNAYPPFWYFFGHTAMCIAEDSDDFAEREEYYRKAKEHFTHYEEMNKFNILREDQLTCSFALEFVDLLMLEEKPDETRINNLIKVAIEKAGNNLDILQLCAVESLRIGDRDNASKLFKILVNEEYNEVINAQLLSCIYIQQKKYVEYSILAKRVPEIYLFPKPQNSFETESELEARFQEVQKGLLKKKFRVALQDTIKKYSEAMIRQVSIFDLDEQYDDNFFDNTDRAKRNRKNKATNLFNDEEKANYYMARMSNLNIPVMYANLVDDMLQNVLSDDIFSNNDLREEAVGLVAGSMYEKKDVINGLQTSINNNTFKSEEYDRLQNLGIELLVGKSFEKLYRYICTKIEISSGESLMSLDGDLFKYCSRMGISIPEIAVDVKNEKDNEIEIPHINVNMFGGKAVIEMKAISHRKEMLEFVKNQMKNINVSENASIMYGDETDNDFSGYFINDKFKKYPSIQVNAIMVIAGVADNLDMVFTTEGVVYLQKGKVKKKVPYNKISMIDNELDLWGKKVSVTNINANGLYRVIKGLATKYTHSEDERIEYVGKMLSPMVIKRWFEDNSSCDIEGSAKAIVLPKSPLVDELTLYVPDNIDEENYLYQIVYDPSCKLLLDYRIVEFEDIQAKFKQALDNLGAEGCLKIE